MQIEAYLEPRTSAQQARRQRIIDAAVSLGLQGGYDAVQMRDVATRANVALGTVYRYFTGKDHLLSSMFLVWLERLDATQPDDLPRAETARQRTTEMFDSALQLMGREPKLVGAVLTALSSADPDAAKCQQKAAQKIWSLIASRIGTEEFADAEDRAAVISHVWFSALVRWVNGRNDMTNVRFEIIQAVELLLPDPTGYTTALCPPAFITQDPEHARDSEGN